MQLLKLPNTTLKKRYVLSQHLLLRLFSSLLLRQVLRRITLFQALAGPLLLY